MAQLEGKGHPVVLAIPDEHGRKHGGGDRNGEVGPRMSEAVLQAGVQQAGQRDTSGDEHAGELRGHGETNAEAREGPPSGFATAGVRRVGGVCVGVERADGAVQRPRHKAEHRRIGGGEHRTRGGEWEAGKDERRGARGLVPFDAPSRLGDRECGKTTGENREQTHAERGLAKERGAGSHQQCDHRGMIEIAGRERARPVPVVGLVGKKRHHGANDEAQNGRADNDCERVAPGARVCHPVNFSIAHAERHSAPSHVQSPRLVYQPLFAPARRESSGLVSLGP